MSSEQESENSTAETSIPLGEKKNRVKRYWKEIKGNVYARLQYKDDNGKWKEKLKPITDKRTAQRVVEEMRRELEHHGEETLTSDKVTFKQLADKYRAAKIFAPEIKDGRKVGGLKSYKSVESHLNVLIDYFGSKLIRSIRPSDIESFKRKRLNTSVEIEHNLKEESKDENGKKKITRRKEIKIRPRKIASVNRELALLRAILYFAVREGWLMQNPTAKVANLVNLANEVERDRVLTPEEEQRLLGACTGKRAHIRAVLIVALDTAMRPDEIFKLRWRDILFDKDAILLPAEITKTERARIIPFLSRRVKEELERLWESSPKNLSDLVFGGMKSINTAFENARASVGLDDYRFRDCRHTATTRMVLHTKMSHAEIMKITGHREMKTFLRYISLTPESLQLEPFRLENYLTESNRQLQIQSEAVN